MITTTAQIIAQISDPKQSEKLQGKGVVEKKLDDTTYLIRFSSGKIKVKVTSGSLTPDTVVQVKSRSGKIILQPVSIPVSHVDKIVLTGTRQEAAANKALHELLSIITDIAAAKKSSQPERDFDLIVKKLAATLQNNQQLLDLNKDLQTTVKKIILYASQQQETTDHQTLSDIKALVQSLQQKLADLCCQQRNSIKLPIPVEQGFILFANKEEAIEWLIKTQPEIDKSVFENLALPKTGPVIIRTVNAGDGTSIAIVMNKEEGALILDAHIHSEAKSPLWKTVPADSLLSILESKGSITTETIESIDKILQLYGSSSQTQQTPPADIAKPVVQQWISLMLDNDTLLQTLTSNTPAHSAEDIVQVVEHDILKSVPKAALISEIIKDVLTNTINNPNLPKTEIIAHAFEKMGYNLEHELAKMASSGTADKADVSVSVKAALLSLIFQTLPHEESFAPLPTAESETVREASKEVYHLRAIDSMIQTLMKVVDKDLEKVIVEYEKQEAQQSQKSFHETVQVLKKIIGDFIRQLSADNQKIMELLNKEETPPINKIEIEKLLNALLQFIEKNKHEIQHYSDIIKGLTPSEEKQLINTFIEKTTDIIDLITAQLEVLYKSIKNLQTIPLNAIEEQNAFLKQTAADKINNFFKPLDNLLNTLLTTLKPAQTDQSSTNQIQPLIDNLYKTVINARNSIVDEIATFTQKVMKGVESNKGYTPANINASIKNLATIVNTLNNNLLSTLAEGKKFIEHAFQNILQRFSTAFTHWTGQSDTIVSETEQNISRLAHDFKESLPQSFLQQLISQKDSVKEGDLSIIKAFQNSISETLDQIKHHSSQISNNFRSPEFTIVKSLEQQLNSTLKTIESSIKNMVINARYTIDNAEEKFIQNMQSLQRGESNQATVSKNMQSIANRLSYDINRIFDNTVKEILTLLEKIAKEVEKNPEHLLRQVNQTIYQTKQEVHQLIRTINRQIDNFSSRTERAFDSTLPDGIRQQVEAALSRLESLQLLAKPTPTSEGQQQILSFPMKIGEEWTDVNILLIKERLKKRGKVGGNKFAVRMYVSPSQTGSIIVNMDYHVKHKLNVRIEFEKNEARLWFNKHKERLIDALNENGMPSIALSLESTSPKKSPKKRVRPSLPIKKGKKKSKIDISV